MRIPLALIVEGHCEYDTYPTFIEKILGNHWCPISNAKGIGNITKNIGDELLTIIKTFSPKKIIVTLDYREALREKIVGNCQELKELVNLKCEEFQKSQKNGSLIMPDEIVVIIVDKTYETWLISDYEALKTNSLIDEKKITEEFKNVDEEISNPNEWLKSKLKDKVDLKSKVNRKAIAKSIRIEVAAENSRSFRKFVKEISNSKVT